jgi:hypothetical protein
MPRINLTFYDYKTISELFESVSLNVREKAVLTKVNAILDLMKLNRQHQDEMDQKDQADYDNVGNQEKPTFESKKLPRGKPREVPL